MNPGRASFNQGAAPVIAVFNQATTPLGVDLDKLIAAMRIYVAAYLYPTWGFKATFVKSTGFIPGSWAIAFLDDADQPGALAYHDLTPDGLPEAKVFVRTTLQNNDLVSVSATHELAEMAVDPAINIMCVGADGTTMLAYESCDPVEALSFPINGIQMSDFVLPSYFEGFRAANSVKFDHMGQVTKPFEILAGGYQTTFANGQWSQTFGSQAKAMAFAEEDRRGHRSEQRKRRLIRADPAAIARGAMS